MFRKLAPIATKNTPHLALSEVRTIRHACITSVVCLSYQIARYPKKDKYTLNVGQLKKLLESLPNDMEIVNDRHSDYSIVKIDEISIVKGVEHDGWVMRSHPTMSEENKRKEKQYLRIQGN